METKYEEALARAREGRPMEEIFPELRESEDERTRKDLITALRDYGAVNKVSTFCGKPIDELIAWLEKQKEPEEELSIRLNGLMQEYVKSGKDEEEQEHRLKCYQLFWDALGDSEFFEQKEQKPAEWSEEDEKMLECIINVLDRLGFEGFRKSSRDQDIEEDRFYYKEIQWLKNRLKSFRPQKLENL